MCNLKVFDTLGILSTPASDVYIYIFLKTNGKVMKITLFGTTNNQ